MSVINRNSVRTLVCVAALASTASLAAAPASNSVHLKYTKEQLAQPEVAETLYRRIESAARQVCHKPDIRELGLYSAYERCYRQAVDNAVASVGETSLTALHRKQMQRTTVG